MAIFDRDHAFESSPQQGRFYLIIGILATVIGVEAQLDLTFLTPATLVPSSIGTVGNTPGALTSIRVIRNSTLWVDKTNGVTSAFAKSQSRLWSVQLQILLFQTEPDVVYCSIGANSMLPGAGNTFSNWVSFDISAKFDWRAPCKPAQVPLRETTATCSVVLTQDGDLQLLDVAANDILWRSNTSGVGRANLTLDDFANLSLFTTNDKRTRWHSRLNDSAGYDTQCGEFNTTSTSGDDAGKSSWRFRSGGACGFFVPLLTAAATAFLTFI